MQSVGRKRTGQIKEISKDVFQLRLQPKKADGTDGNYFEQFEGTRIEAEKRLSEIVGLSFDLQNHPERFMTVAEMYAKKLSVLRHDIEAKTLEDYQNMFRRYVEKELGDILLINIKHTDISNLYDAMRERGLSSQTIRKTHQPLKAAFEFAVQKEWITVNPCARVKPPKHKATKKQYVPSIAEIQKLFAGCRDVSERALWAIAAFTGARPQEYTAMRWKHVDLQSGLWQITEVISELQGYNIVRKTPKTEKSKRTLPLHPVLLEDLKAHRILQMEAFLSKGLAWNDDVLIFPAKATNNYRSNSNINLSFKTLLKRAGLPTTNFSPYSLRHAFATNGLESGANLKDVSELLGHSSIRLTADTYAHVSSERKRDVMNFVGDAMVKQKRA